MGRRDAVQFTLECVAEWRRLGALVTFEPGWETRGNGTSANYEGADEHHTATPSSLARPFPTRSMLISGRSDLPGPLCNEATPVGPGDKPHIHVIAAHPANHAGASGGKGTAPLPVTTLFNPRVRGNEIDYAGTVPMTPGQRLAALIHGRGVVNVLGRGVDYIKAHAETSVTGKWDPGYAPGRTIDMAAFRRDAAALTGGTPAAILQEDYEMAIITAPNRPAAVVGPGFFRQLNDEEWGNHGGAFGPVIAGNDRQWDLRRSIALTGDGVPRQVGELHGKVIGSRFDLDGRPSTGEDDMLGHILNTEALLRAGGVDLDALAGKILAGLAGNVGITKEDVKDAVRDLLTEGLG